MKDNIEFPVNFIGSIAESSVFDTRKLDDIYDEIIKVYLDDSRPWVIGYSGGKDSTTALQLIWKAIEKYKNQGNDKFKDIFVIASDTLVETPAVVSHLDKNLDRIDHEAQKQELPFVVQKLRPKTNDSFWVNLIGRGYPAPTNTFRWCTDRMKIRPANDFIIEKASKFGEVVVILGVRKQESTTRAQVMSLHSKKGSLLKTHSSIPAAYVYTPIEDFSIDDVWTYLIQNKSPWGANNRDLVAMYREADGECPLVIDKTTPSCGNGRFGCWTCTVVREDKSMTAMIDNGADWMEPMLEFRNYIAATQNPETKLKYRSHRRRDGRITPKRESSIKKDNGEIKVDDLHNHIVPGPYELWFRKEMLEKLLETEKEVRMLGDDKKYSLIQNDELLLIRRLWMFEENDWEDSVSTIYKDVYFKSLKIGKDDIGMFDNEDLAILSEFCEEENVELDMLLSLLSVERSMHGMLVRPKIRDKIEKILRKDWYSKEFILEEIMKGESLEDILVKENDI